MISDPHVEKFIEISGQKIPVWLYGNPKNPPIIFIHGYLKGFSDYAGDLPHRYLRKRFFVISFDLPGFGKSKNLKAENKGAISEIIKKFTKGRIVLFGASYGGAVALRFASEYPEKVSKLIIAATPVYPAIGLLKPLLRRKLSFIGDFAFLNSKDLSGIKIPCILFYGKNDRKAPVWMGKRLNKFLPNSKLIVVNDRIHSWFLHRIDETGILSEIEKFLDSPSS